MRSTLWMLSCGAVFALAVAAMSPAARAGADCAIDEDECDRENTSQNTGEIWGNATPGTGESRIDLNTQRSLGNAGDISANRSDIDDLQTDVNDADRGLAATNSLANENATGVSENESRIDVQAGRISDNETAIADNAQAANDAAATASNAANAATNNADDIQQLQDEVWGDNAPGMESRIDVNSFLTSKHANDINNLEGDMNALEVEFDGVRDTANAVADTANEALNTANGAAADAGNALTAANAAQSTANAVADTANEALNTASGAAADAGSALTAANAAQSTADNNQGEIWGDADPNDPGSVSRIDRNEAVSENNASSISALGVDVTGNTQDIATNTEEIFVGGDTTGPSRITMNELRLDDLAAGLQGFEHRLGGLEDRVNEMQKDIDRVGAITMALDNPGMPDAGAGKVALYGGAATVSGQVGFGVGLNYQVTDSLRVHGGGGTDLGGNKWAAKVGGVFTLN